MNDYLFSRMKTDKIDMFFSKCQTKDIHFYMASSGCSTRRKVPRINGPRLDHCAIILRRKLANPDE
jgi:hypothetical protein